MTRGTVASALVGVVLSTALVACSDDAPPPVVETELEAAAERDSNQAARTERPRPRPAHVRRDPVEGNHPPVIRSLTVRGSDEDPAIWLAVVEADDPDGDEVRLDFVWLVNGEPAARGEQTYDPTSNRRGDAVHVEVTPHDGKIAGATAASGRLSIENVAPTITSTPPASMSGGVYRYMVEARDAENGPPLTYELLQKPDGMRIDPFSGELTWRPNANQAGTHTIEIAVTDSAGARSTQEFALPIVAPESTPAAPAY